MILFRKFYSPDEVIGVSLQADTGGAVENVGSFRKQLREAQQDVIEMNEKFGATSEHAINAAEKVAKLKDAIGDAKTLTDAFNPDAKFNSVANSIRVVTGGFVAYRGAMALIGGESKEVENALLKVQGALALSEGINSILEAKDTFKSLAAVIQSTSAYQKIYNASTTAAAFVTRLFGGAVIQTSLSFKVLRGAMISTGIGALVVGLGFLISKIIDWTSSTNDAKEAQEALNSVIENQNKLFESDIAAIEYNAKVKVEKIKQHGKDQGKIEAEILGVNQKAQQDKVQTYEFALAELRGHYAAADATERKKIGEEIVKKEDDLNKLRLQGTLETEQGRTKIAEDARNKAKQLSDKQREEVKAQIERDKQALLDLKKIRDDNFASQLFDETARQRLLIQAEEKSEIYRINQLKIGEDIRRQLLSETRLKFGQQLIDFDNKAADEQKQKQEERLKSIEDKATASFDRTKQHLDELESKKNEQKKLSNEILSKGGLNAQQQAELNQLDILYSEKYRIAQGNAELIKQLDEQYGRDSAEITNKYTTQKIDSLKAVGQAGEALSELIGKQTAAGKALGIATAIMNTWIGVSEVLKTRSVLPEPFNTISKIASIATTVATGINAVKNIAKVNVPGGGGGGGAGSIGASVSAPISLPRPVQSGTGIDQNQINSTNNAAGANRSYVLDSDRRNQEDVWRRTNRTRRLT